MKKLFLLLAAAGMMFTACESGNDDNGGGNGGNDNPPTPPTEEPYIRLSEEAVSINPDGGSVNVTVYSSDEWSVTTDNNWCTASAEGGEACEDGQVITFSAEVAEDKREATFVFTCGEKEATLTVSQDFKKIVVADGNQQFDVRAAGNNIELKYKATVECEVVIPEEAQGWITVADAVRSLDSNSVTLTVAANDTGAEREAIVMVAAVEDAELYAEYVVIQAQNNVLTLQETSKTVDHTAQSISVQYEANVDIDVVIPAEASWITAGAKEENAFILDIAANNTGAEREAIVKVVAVEDAELYAEYTVTQAQNNVLTLKETSKTIDYTAQSISVQYEANVDINVVIPAEASWVTAGANEENSFSLDIAENDTEDNRTAVIKVVAVGDEDLYAEYTITQIKKPGVDVKGILEYTSTDGNIVTPYNTNAFGGNIISNEYADGKGVIKFDNEVSAIGAQAFMNCSTLATITIPATVAEVGAQAFYGCPALESFSGKFASEDGQSLIDGSTLVAYIIPDGLTKYTTPANITKIGAKVFYGCTTITELEIRKQITAIGEGAFENCSALVTVDCESATPATLGANAFDGNAEKRQINVPINGWETYRAADGWKEYAARILPYFGVVIE